MHSFNPCSSNLKLGPIASTRSARSSCPSSCVFKGNGCYGDNFPLSMHWAKLDHQGLSWSELMDKVRTIPRGAMWRHNEVGDLDTIDASEVRCFDDAVAEVAGWITPRIGGVGPMTRAMLLRNAVLAAEKVR